MVAVPRKEMQPEIEWRKRVAFLLARIRFLHQVIELAAGAFRCGLNMNELPGVHGAESAGISVVESLTVGTRCLSQAGKR